MDIYPAGSITFVISENHRSGDRIENEEAQQLASNLADYFQFQLSENHLEKIITVTGFEFYRGCITVVITVGVVAAAAGGFTVVNFFKNYKEVREGLDKLLEDMKNIKIWVKKKIFLQKSNQPVITLIEDKVEGKKPDEPFEIMFQQVIDQYNHIDPEQKKFWSAGQEITIINEKGEYCKYSLAVKREDILLPADKITGKSKKNKKAKK